MNVYFEVGPLREREYTGISQVTAALAEQFIGDAGIDSAFFFGQMLVPKACIESLLQTRNGELLEWYLQRIPVEPAPLSSTEQSVGIFPNRKTVRGAFAKDCQIVHDLSTLLTPQFHHPDTIEYHATTLEQDMLTNDLTFCVSEATRTDVLAYFPSVESTAVVTLPLAAGAVDGVLPAAAAMEPYILVLGTIEPRKNVAQVLECIRARPSLTQKYRFVFLGRFGWGSSIEELIDKHGLQEQYEKGRVAFPGFAPEHIKNLLIRNAKVVVYPSLFEGFGLPVIEAAILGVPCVTTRSSSLPEAGGTSAYYFDPFTQGDFERVLMRAIIDLEVKGDAVREQSVEWVKRFSWERTYRLLKERIDGLFAPQAEY